MTREYWGNVLFVAKGIFICLVLPATFIALAGAFGGPWGQIGASIIFILIVIHYIAKDLSA
jgi:hypothetical protein